jgi:hypothetical protein
VVEDNQDLVNDSSEVVIVGKVAESAVRYSAIGVNA